MRCENCAKFVSYNDPPDVEVESYDGGNPLSANVRVVLTCMECGGELKDSEIEIEVNVDHECDADDVRCGCHHAAKEHSGGNGFDGEGGPCGAEDCQCSEFRAALDDPEYEWVDEPSADGDSRLEDAKVTKVKSGPHAGEMRVTPARYRKTFYGASISGTVNCLCCGTKEIDVEGHGEDAASSFNEI